jgi:hypothetical protein
MRRVTQIAIFSLIGLIVLTACLADNSTTLLIDSETQVNDLVETGQAYGNSEAAIYMSSGYDLTLEVGPLYPKQDLSLLSNTGRPQFLNFYADW